MKGDNMDVPQAWITRATEIIQENLGAGWDERAFEILAGDL